MLNWEFEVDETFIGGKARNMHSDVKARRITGRGPGDKAIVVGMLERGGLIKTKVVDDRSRYTLHRTVKEAVAIGSALYSDDLSAYDGLQSDYAHQTVNHAVRYVDGVVHTNTLENFWALLKRCINGTWVSVEPFQPVPLSGRAGVQVQRAEGEGRGSVLSCDQQHLREAVDVQTATGKDEAWAEASGAEACVAR